jgi:hypothetical protein
MKKIIFSALIILFFSMPIFAQEQGEEEKRTEKKETEKPPVKYILNFTNFGIGTNLPKNTGYYMVEGSLELMNFGVEFTGLHLELTLSPFRAVGWYEGGLSCSFINTYLRWNALDLGKFFVSPAASFHYLFMGENFYFDRYVFSAGLHSGLSAETGKIKYNVFTLETGFRLIEGEARFFAGIKFDFIMKALSSAGFFD